jgi:hypothetical protein
LDNFVLIKGPPNQKRGFSSKGDSAFEKQTKTSNYNTSRERGGREGVHVQTLCQMIQPPTV